MLGMRTLEEIRQEIDNLSARRADVLHDLAAGHDEKLRAEHERLEDEIAALWEEQRVTRANIRFGNRDEIIQRARHDERLSRAA